MVAHTCNPRTQEVGQEDQEFEAILDYIVNPRPPWKIETLFHIHQARKEGGKEEVGQKGGRKEMSVSEWG